MNFKLQRKRLGFRYLLCDQLRNSKKDRLIEYEHQKEQDQQPANQVFRPLESLCFFRHGADTNSKIKWYTQIVEGLFVLAEILFSQLLKAAGFLELFDEIVHLLAKFIVAFSQAHGPFLLFKRL
jgi:hypothetical protein